MGEQQMHASAGIAYADDVPHHGDLVMRSVGHHHRCLKNIITQVIYFCSQSKGLSQNSIISGSAVKLNCEKRV